MGITRAGLSLFQDLFAVFILVSIGVLLACLAYYASLQLFASGSSAGHYMDKVSHETYKRNPRALAQSSFVLPRSCTVLVLTARSRYLSCSLATF